VFKRIDTVFFPVRNLDAAIGWYSKHLGLTLRWKAEGYACFDLAETPLTLVEKGSAFTPVTDASFNFYAADIDSVYATLKAAGITVDDEIAAPPGVRFFGFHDLDGNRLEVCWWPEQ